MPTSVGPPVCESCNAGMASRGHGERGHDRALAVLARRGPIRVRNSLMAEEFWEGPRVVEVALAEPFVMRSRDFLADKHEPEHAGGNGEGRAHAHGQPISVCEGTGS